MAMAEGSKIREDVLERVQGALIGGDSDAVAERSAGLQVTAAKEVVLPRPARTGQKPPGSRRGKRPL